MNLRTMQETRGRLVQNADQLIRQALAEKRDLTAAEHEKIGGMKNELFGLDQKIARELADIRSESFQGNNRSDMSLKGYSLLRALNGAATGRLDGIELEASQEIARRQGTNPSGFFVPNSILAERRGMSVSGDSGIYGGDSVQTSVSNDFLDALRPLSQIIAAGASIFSGLTSNLAFPKSAAASTASWVTETAALTEQTPEIEQVLLSPKRVGSFTELSNQLLVQSNPGVEQFIRRDLLSAIAVAIDNAAIQGTGTSGQPTGILNTAGIGSVAGGTNGAAPTWSHIVSLVSAVAAANADLGSLRFLTNSKVLAKLRSTAKVASTDSVMILEGNELLAYQILGSNNVPSNLTKGTASAICSAIIFGNFEDVLVGQFGAGSDVIVDRFSKATTGITRVITNSYVDIAIRRPESFSAMKDVLTA